MTLDGAPAELHHTACFKENFVLPFASENTDVGLGRVETSDARVLVG